jgi:hypothetical protein
MKGLIQGKPGRSILVLLLIPAIVLLWLALLLVTARVYALGSSAPASAPSETAELAFEPLSSTLLVSDTITVNVVITGVIDLYGVELALAFDPEIVTVVDDNPGAAGIQITAGGCPQASFVAQNAADNSSGVITYAAASLAPAEPCTGGGTVATITFQGVTQGTSPISFTTWLLSDLDIQSITTTVVNGSIVVQQRPGIIQGALSLQGRGDHSGALIEVWAAGELPVTTTLTNLGGSYALSLSPDSYTVTVEMAGYLDAWRIGVPVDSDDLVDLPQLTLPCGDPNDDDLVNILDLSLIGGRYRLACGDPGWDDRADMINDCVINILDLTCTGANYGRAAPVNWP